MPLASVIMPCFNHARFVAEAAAGILRQSQPDLELIIVDDCSTDDSWKVIQDVAKTDSRVKAIRHAENKGASKSRNDGMRVAQGEFIGFCDADDFWEPRKLQNQVELLRAHPEVHLAYSDSTIMDGQGREAGQRFSGLFRLPRNPSGQLFTVLVRRNFINIQTVLMRRECVERMGYFDEQIKWVEDWWYWVRLSRAFQFQYSTECLARYRVHGQSTNVVQKRGYPVNRYKVLGRILREYPDLPLYLKAAVVFNMGAALSDIGKYAAARRLFWRAIGLSLADVRGLITSCRALRRLVMNASARHPGLAVPSAGGRVSNAL